VQIQGQYLKVGRPKHSTCIIPTPNQLLCGNPNFTPSMTGGRNVQKKNTSSTLVQQALQQAKIIEPQADSAMINAQTRLEISNFPSNHTKDMIQKICEVFG